MKFTTLSLNAAGDELTNGGSATAYKAQLYVYNRMLGRLQGYEPPASYLLGRGWHFKSKGVDYRGDSAMDRLAPIPQGGTITNKVPIAHAVEQALDLDASRPHRGPGLGAPPHPPPSPSSTPMSAAWTTT